ncbi:LacI family transcriptional regulator [Clostridium sp. OM02-18AC]|uniref:LacI family DNA-binding transcriptional regulator n=1 Tax=Clostridium sp. OM02-18AC TaxID=2292311 RepID=UPI000E4EDF9E|nr:LacI family DNA-binding transcriptional regulator [Clostridium sp. OM02-18AC]RHV67513.1 LacI family transcriptional regulator [Clostridium sp. OM02-18AC]
MIELTYDITLELQVNFMKVKITDVARKAGVSTATVSYVINNSRAVGAETKKKVEDAIRELNYVPNLSARKLKKGKSHLIGLILPNCYSISSISIIESCEQYLSEHGYHILLMTTNQNHDAEKEALQIFSSGIVDGILLESLCDTPDAIIQELPVYLPAVVIDNCYSGLPVDRIGYSANSVMQEAVASLIAKGHKKIGLLSGPRYLSGTQDTLTSFQNATAHFGLSKENSPFVCTRRSEGRIRQAVSELHANGCSAVIFSNFNMLLDSFQDPLTGQISIPSDMEVLSFYESSTDKGFYESISKIYRPSDQMAKIACRLLLNRIQGDTSPIQSINLECVFSPHTKANL